ANQCAIALRQARLRKALQTQVTELERLNQLKDDFLSTVSHELRTPMTNIKMAVQMLKTRLGVMNLDAQLAPSSDVVINQDNFLKTIRYLKILSHECQRETNLINDLLDLTRLEAETTPGLLQEVALQQWIPHLAESFRERMQQQQQHLHVSIPEQLPSLRTNLTVLERILTELLQNACKYTPTGESITISATTCEPEQYASGLPSLGPSFLLTVSNSGVEISDSDRASIFDKFYRIPNGDPWKNGGTGLGLALVKRLVEQLSGSIAVDSYDNSVRFIVKLIHLS
ncbi:MAG TPA: HAMP domain-containing sensor histidine kinase, partial [Chroococcidiopsis sp.]